MKIKSIFFIITFLIVIITGTLFAKSQYGGVKKEGDTKRQIMVNFIDGDDWVFNDKTVIKQILNKNYDVVISDQPEYLFFSDRSYNNLDYDDCIKIFYTEENCEPDINEDLRKPQCLQTFYKFYTIFYNFIGL